LLGILREKLLNLSRWSSATGANPMCIEAI